MAISLLVVTPDSNFGSLLRKGLDLSNYDIFTTADFSEAIHFVRKNSSPLAILDTEMEDLDLSILDIGYALRQIKPDIQFILVTRSDQEVKPGKLAPVLTLTKPVSISDLSKSLEKFLIPNKDNFRSMDKPMSEAEIPARALAETSQLMWLKDVSKAAQHLTRLTLESSAQAALITRQNELWAYAGQLSREAAEELTHSIQRYWDRENESDLLRFVRLQSTEAQHMLYARKLSANMILALVFDAETPFSTIRSQAGMLVKNLAEGSFGDTGKMMVAPAASPVSAPAFNPVDDDGDEEEDLPPISELLGDVPPPTPHKQIHTPKINLPWDQPSAQPPAPNMAIDEPKTAPPPVISNTPPDGVSRFSQESSPAVRRDTVKRPVPAMDETFSTNVSKTETDLGVRHPDIPDDLQMTRKHQAVRDDLEALIETRPQTISESVTEVAHRILLEPASPAMVNLTYACLLVPRFEHHHLVGDAAERLTEWVPQACIAFGWRLEHMSVRPDYLQWVVRVPPSTAPGYIIRIIRQQTSERIFADFPRLKADNPSGDFWAPGYLIMGSSQPLPQKLVRDHIKQTRTRQGLGHE